MKRFFLLTLMASLMLGCQTTQQLSVTEEPAAAEAVQAETGDQAKQETESEAANQVEMEKEPVAEVEVNVAPVMTPAPEPIVQPIIKERKTTMILMKTSKGDITIELDKEKAPKTVANFMKYVESGHYTGTIFHRVIDNFMIQGGGFTKNMSQKNAPHTVENEADNGLSNDLGTIAMARTQDPHSGGAQFFINVKDNDFLNHRGKNIQGWGYCVFGKVVDGMDVVNAIKGVATGNAGHFQDVPVEPITIEEVVVVD